MLLRNGDAGVLVQERVVQAGAFSKTLHALVIGLAEHPVRHLRTGQLLPRSRWPDEPLFTLEFRLLLGHTLKGVRMLVDR